MSLRAYLVTKRQEVLGDNFGAEGGAQRKLWLPAHPLGCGIRAAQSHLQRSGSSEGPAFLGQSVYMCKYPSVRAYNGDVCPHSADPHCLGFSAGKFADWLTVACHPQSNACGHSTAIMGLSRAVDGFTHLVLASPAERGSASLFPLRYCQQESFLR